MSTHWMSQIARTDCALRDIWGNEWDINFLLADYVETVRWFRKEGKIEEAAEAVADKLYAATKNAPGYTTYAMTDVHTFDAEGNAVVLRDQTDMVIKRQILHIVDMVMFAESCVDEALTPAKRVCTRATKRLCPKCGNIGKIPDFYPGHFLCFNTGLQFSAVFQQHEHLFCTDCKTFWPAAF